MCKNDELRKRDFILSNNRDWKVVFQVRYFYMSIVSVSVCTAVHVVGTFCTALVCTALVFYTSRSSFNYLNLFNEKLIAGAHQSNAFQVHDQNKLVYIHKLALVLGNIKSVLLNSSFMIIL